MPAMSAGMIAFAAIAAATSIGGTIANAVSGGDDNKYKASNLQKSLGEALYSSLAGPSPQRDKYSSKEQPHLTGLDKMEFKETPEKLVPQDLASTFEPFTGLNTMGAVNLGSSLDRAGASLGGQSLLQDQPNLNYNPQGPSLSQNANTLLDKYNKMFSLSSGGGGGGSGLGGIF